MGRRRTIGEARSAGAGRACRHPLGSLEYQAGEAGRRDRIRCQRCGQQLLSLDESTSRRRDKRWRPKAAR
jgi:hypothetical protein